MNTKGHQSVWTVRTKLLLLVGIGFVIVSAAVTAVADRMMTAKTNREQNALFAERLGSIASVLARKQELLAKTGMQAAYLSGFQEAAVKELSGKYYSGHAQTSYPFIVDLQGRIVMHPSLKAGDETPNRVLPMERLRAAKEGEVEYVYQGETKWGRYATYEPWGWVIVHAIPVSEKYLEVRQFRTGFLAIMGSTAVGVLAVLFVLISVATGPIRQLTLAVSGMASGDLTREAPTARQDEIGILARSFAEMRDSIREKIRTLDQEIIERRRAEEQLRESQEKYRSIVENLGIGVALISPKMEVLELNGQMRQWFPRVVPGQGVICYRHFNDPPREAPCSYCPTERTLADGQVHEAITDTPAGSETIHYRVISSPVKGAQGQVVAAVEMVEDITKRRQMERELLNSRQLLEQRVQERTAELLRANRQLRDAQAGLVQAERRSAAAQRQAEEASSAKSQFLAKMSHEIRTPMNGVVGMLELIGGTKLEDRQRHYVQIARTSATALLGLINDILDFSKIEAGKLELDVADMDLWTVVEEAAALLAGRASEKGLELICDLSPDVPRTVKGDPLRLRQVLVNILNNAIKFTDRGTVSVRAEVSARESDAVEIRFTVRDTGQGIPEDRLDRLFEVFSQVDTSAVRKASGTGLGLAISKRLAELMGGRIGVSTRVGDGSEFWFTARFGCAANADQSSQLLADATVGGGLRALAVDDNPVLRQTLSALLSRWGFQAETASDAPSALKKLHAASEQAQPFGLAFLDANMPQMSGMDLARQIRDSSRLRTVPMVLLTPISELPSQKEIQDHGFAACLAKPVRQQELRDAIATALGRTSHRHGAEPERAASLPADQPPPQERSVRILIAEDNEINQEVARELLIGAGYTCEIVPNGLLAVQAVQESTYDLVLMDCQMPKMDGFQASRRIRELERAGKVLTGGRKSIPIVALTANAIKGDRELCLAAGMNDYLSKPIEPQQMFALLDRLLAERPEVPRTGAQPTQPPTPPAEPAPDASAARGPAEPARVTGASVARPEDGPRPFDMRKALGRCMNNRPLLDGLLVKFAQRLAADLQELEAAIKDTNPQKVAFFAHAIKGAAANLEAGTLSQAARALEQAGRAADMAAVPQLMEEVSAAAQTCLDYVSAPSPGD